jgi:hypothetical protein
VKLTAAEKAEILTRHEEAARRERRRSARTRVASPWTAGSTPERKVPADVYEALKIAEHYRAWEADTTGKTVSHPGYSNCAEAMKVLEAFIREEKKL